MGIHYDYKSTRGDKAMKKEAKRKARIEERRAKKTINIPQSSRKKRNAWYRQTYHARRFNEPR